MLADKRADLGRLEKALGAPRFSIARPDVLREVLALTPGSVTPFGLINDTQRRVNVILDEAMIKSEWVNFHPLHNAASTTLRSADLLRFVRALSYRSGNLAEIAPGQHRQTRCRRFLVWRRIRQSARGAVGPGPCCYFAQPSAADTAEIKEPIIAQNGELDPRITDGWPAFVVALTQAHVPHEGHIYKGANHGFHNDTTPRYDEAAAKEAR
jgi:Aminoacyl-tRNA editing domain/Dienelactone hydrolase family